MNRGRDETPNRRRTRSLSPSDSPPRARARSPLRNQGRQIGPGSVHPEGTRRQSCRNGGRGNQARKPQAGPADAGPTSAETDALQVHQDIVRAVSEAMQRITTAVEEEARKNMEGLLKSIGVAREAMTIQLAQVLRDARQFANTPTEAQPAPPSAISDDAPNPNDGKPVTSDANQAGRTQPGNGNSGNAQDTAESLRHELSQERQLTSIFQHELTIMTPTWAKHFRDFASSDVYGVWHCYRRLVMLGHDHHPYIAPSCLCSNELRKCLKIMKHKKADGTGFGFRWKLQPRSYP